MRSFDGFGTFTEAAAQIFQGLIESAGHPRVVLVLIGIDRTAGRGMVGTNLGAGLNHMDLTREEAADLFLAAGERFSVERIGEGVDRLASRLEEWNTTQNASRKELFQEELPRSWHQRYGVKFYPALLLLLGAGFMGWRAWRAKICPGCGGVMRTRVRLGGPGGAAVRTRKCFECGFVQKRRLEGWSLGKRRSRGTPRQ